MAEEESVRGSPADGMDIDQGSSQQHGDIQSRLIQTLQGVDRELDEALNEIRCVRLEVSDPRPPPQTRINGPEDEPVGFFAHQRKKRQGHGGPPKGRSAKNNKLLEDIHTFSHELLGVHSIKTAPGVLRKWTSLPRPPINPEGPLPTNVEGFTLAWTKPVTHRYNVAAIRNFIMAMINNPDYPYGLEMYPTIREKWARWYKTLRQRYERETVAEESEKVDYSRRQEASANGRRTRLFYARRTILSSFKLLHKYLPVIDRLGLDGMSSDEEADDVEPLTKHRYYLVSRKAWRSEEASLFLTTIDALGRAIRTENRGHPPRARYEAHDRVSQSLLVDGLPRNAYDAKYLESMDEWQREELNIEEEPLDFKFPAFVSQIINGQESEDEGEDGDDEGDRGSEPGNGSERDEGHEAGESSGAQGGAGEGA